MLGGCAAFWPTRGAASSTGYGGDSAAKTRLVIFVSTRPAIKIFLRSKYYVQIILLFLLEIILHIIAVAFYHLYRPFPVIYPLYQFFILFNHIISLLVTI